MAEQFDLVIIGGGPGGYGAALYGASAGLTVAIIEKDKMGGTCLHRGCVPAKEFLETAATFRHVANAKEFGVEAGQPIVDFAVSQARKEKVVDSIYRGLTGVMKGRKIVTFNGVGSLGAGHLVTVKGDDGATVELHGTNVVLASGSVARTIPGFEVDGTVVLTSDEVLMLDKLPSSAVVIGGGAIGCEFASLMSDLGVQVTILEALPKILPGCDADVARVVVRSFEKRGIQIR
ncbi:MAG TPA: FAD-dependent oxidoreductase, partial [Acidimicrobiales bacterium]|nr:FAD-dependent oxidoreductase [Acidimicrobiales bacterium]